MTMPASPSAPKPAGDDRNLVAVDATTAASFEDRLHLFWKNNGTAVLTLVVLVLLGIAAKGGWDYLAAQKELGIEKEYAAAATPDQLKAFAAAHADHALAGIALLRVADEAYAAAKPADALAAYEKAIPALNDNPLAARARLGRALAKIGAGKPADGTADLKQLAADAGLNKGLRSEAAYHLASLAADGGNAADVRKYVDQLMQLDPTPEKTWAKRAVSLLANLPAPAATPTPAPAKPDEKKPDASSSMQVKLPGK